MEKVLNKKKIIILILIIFLLILSSIFTILYKKNTGIRHFFDEYIFRKNITENTLPKISIENNISFPYKNYIVCLEKNSLSFYNKSATKIASLDIEISNPIFKSNDDFLCLAEKDGNKLCLISNKNILWQKNIEGNITNIAINKNGFVAVSISDTTYTTICKMFNTEGVELFTTYLSKSYIVDFDISDDNKYLALAEANFSGISAESNIKIISIDKASSGNIETIQYNHIAPIGDLIVNVKYCNDSLLCIYDNHVDVIKENSCSEITNFENSDILFADINTKLIQIEKISNNIFSSEFELQIINPNNLHKNTYTLNKEPKSINTFGNITAINFGTDILFINNSGWLVKHYISSQEVQDILLSDDLAGIVFKDKIEILSF